MNVRVIGGIYGGRLLAAPSGTRTHPMSERVRNALFNTLVGRIENTRVLDAFAGTGSLGIEALSRGAVQATFVERDRVAANILNENIAILRLTNDTKIIRAPVYSWAEKYDGELFDLIFADPPYHDPQFSTVSALFRLLKPGGTMVLSHPGRGEVPIQNGIVVVDNRSYGNANLTFFRREE